MATFYEKNIDALIKKDPLLGSSLFGIQENNRFEVFQGNDALDINILDTEKNDFIYQQPNIELVNQVKNFHEEYVRYPVLFFYGIGNGLLVKALLENDSLEHLIIIEPNIELIYIALNFIDISDDIESERLIIQLSSSVNFTTALKIMERKHVKPYAKLYNLHSMSTYYERNYQDDMNDVSSIFIRAYKHIVVGHGNDTMDALIGIEQHVANIDKMLETYKTTDLFKKKISDVVIIVSTGPSLTKQLPLLKKYASYITIISVDASLPILYKEGIVPDIVTSMERVVETATLFDNLDNKFLKNTYFVVSSLADLYTMYKLQNQKLLISMRPLSYMLYYNLDDFGYLGSGMSASNLAYQLAAHMDYKDIILIGQDLAYSKDGVSHADGHKYTFNENNKNKKFSTLMIEAYGGQGLVKTTIIWDMFRNFFESDINEAAECCEITTYNSTEGGARIIGAIEKPFKDVLEDVVDTSKEKGQIKLRRVRKDLSAKLKKLAKKQTDHMIEYGSTLKKEIEELFLKVTKECEHIDSIDKKDVDYNSILKLIDEIDEIKVEVESLEFSKMYIDTVQSYIYHQELNLAKLMVENSKTDEEKKDKLIKWLQIHKYWLFSLAGGINAQLYAVERGLKLNKLKVNEFKFLDTLVDYNKDKIKNLYSKDSIGFFAVEENISDRDFVDYMKDLYERFPQATFKAFYFYDEQKEFAENIYADCLDRFKFIQPSNIYDIASEIEIWCESFEKPTSGLLRGIGNKLFNDTKHIYRMIFDIEHINDIKYDYIDESNNLGKLLPDTRENKFANSLKDIDEDSLKNLYCKDAIGFLATDENLEDEDFISYIKQIYVKFPNVTFKVFYFNINQKKLVKEIFENEKDRFKFLIVEDIYTICKEIEIYLHNNSSYYLFEFYEIMKDNKFINTIDFNSKYINTKISYFSGKNHPYLENPSFFGFSESQYSECDNLFRIFYNSIINKFSEKKFDLDIDKLFYDFIFYDFIFYSLKYPEIKYEVYKTRSLYKQYMKLDKNVSKTT